MQPHMMAVPVLDRGGAADRLRNHLRRRAITRTGLIEGDLYMLPYWRATGQGPEGETTFHLLAAELGDSRLLRLNLPPANLKPFDAAALPRGSRVVDATRDEAVLRERAGRIGWRVDTLDQLVQFPFWMMRVEDSGRQEGAWIDAVEGRLILHSLKVPSPAPSVREILVMLAPAAALMGAGALLMRGFPGRALWAVVVAAGGGAVVSHLLLRRERRVRGA